MMRPGIALEYRTHGFPRGRLAGRSVGLVVTIRETLFGMVDAASDARRQGWLDRMRDYGSAPRLSLASPPKSRPRCPPIGPALDVRGNARRNLEMAASVDFLDIRHAGWT
jgi:hypothetical protein